MGQNKPRVVWITGASSGLGAALSEEFVIHGDTVVATARSRAKLRQLQKRLQRAGGTFEIYACDLRNEKNVRSVAGKILASHKTVDILINNAGVTYFKDFISTGVAEFDEVVETNLRGLFLTTKNILPSMLKQGRGCIINILSYAAKTTYTESAAYSASKAGAESLMNVLRAETRGKGIKVVNVFPGAILTPIWHPRHQEKYSKVMMKPSEVAKMIYEITTKPPSLMVEDIIIRPQIGDLNV
ncbi:MAG: SDR family oxidoreductase [Ignavibacteriales bacterium]|nr:SDR family oxidoreductase [Ignavibacteriales bacterium]MBI3786834.1 SDR family oxidoreductase [Ignavibacteriales bacterium]